MGLSSNSIIHFTNTKDSLKGILKNNFKIYYCLEEVHINEGSIEFAVPMVSFCDIPLSEVKVHITKYGAYGIGLTKEWAVRQKLNPVLYTEKGSFLSESYLSVYLSYLKEAQHKKMNEMTKEEKSLADILRYIKNYEGDLVRGGQVLKDYRFSDEREWRYALPFDQIESFIVNAVEYQTEEQKKGYNDSLETFRLEFAPNDIKYVIIQNEAEIPEFLEVLKASKGNKYTYNDVERLMTRLITTEQIVQDF
jgi:Putative abortive phage resistance protein AbiGi, antitoxin